MTYTEDKRTFMRYRGHHPISIRIGEKAFNAETLDYSVGGLGILLKDAPTLSESDIVALNIAPLGIKGEGTVVWTSPSPSGTKAGIRLDRAIKGSLKDFLISDVLIGIQRSGRTGVLNVISGSTLKKVYVKDGEMIFSASNRPEERLGDILLDEGIINQEQYDRSVEHLKKTGKRQGTILVELGYLSPQRLIWAVRHQVEHIILSLFALKEGEFEFREGPLPTAEMIVLKLSVANLIYKGVKLGDGTLPRCCGLSPQTVLSFSKNPLNLFQDIDLSEEDRKILSTIDGKKALKDIIAPLPDELDAMKSICALLSTRMISAVGEIVLEEGEALPDIPVDEIIGKEKGKRRYRRYKKSASFRLKHKWELRNAELIDYSLDGVCARVETGEGSPRIGVGDPVELKIESPAINESGKVAWVRGDGSSLTVGVKIEGRIGGSLRDFRLSDIILDLHGNGKTGELELKSGSIQQKVWFRDGDLVLPKSASGEANAEKAVFSLFNITDGRFVFREGKAADDASQAVSVLSPLVARGVKTGHIDTKSFRLPPDAVPQLSPRSAEIIRVSDIDQNDRLILPLIDGEKTIGEIIKFLPPSESEIMKGICALLAMGIIEIEEAADSPSYEDEEAAQDAELVARIEELYSNRESLDYYGILGVGKDAPVHEIKRAYYKAAKDFHPDKHFRLTEDRGMKEKLNAIFGQITSAYSTLSIPDKRKEYDDALARKNKAASLPPKEIAELKFKEGKAELLKGNLAGAERLFAEAAYYDPKAFYLYHHGRALNGLRKFKDAEKALRKALDTDPNNAEYLAEAGHAYLALGLHARAKGCFERALMLEPSNRRAKEGLSKK